MGQKAVFSVPLFSFWVVWGQSQVRVGQKGEAGNVRWPLVMEATLLRLPFKGATLLAEVLHLSWRARSYVQDAALIDVEDGDGMCACTRHVR